MATAQTRDGITIDYTIHGDDVPDRPRLVLVHSLAMSGVVWTGVVQRLAEKARILTYDCRGHGVSTKAPAPYRLETFARDLEDLLDHVGWDSTYLAGASMGGNVSLQFAVLNHERLRGLGLIDTTAWYGPEAPQRWEERAQKAEENGLAPLMDFQESRWFTDGFRTQEGPEVLRCRSVFLANDVAAFAATCRMLGAFDLRSQLSALHLPAAIVVGEEDYATPPAMARELNSGIAGSTLQVIPEARHLTFVEFPDVVAGALEGLLERMSSPS
jgi:3-oxoadipate enol-lactonase